jgi:hypothetical protein
MAVVASVPFFSPDRIASRASRAVTARVWRMARVHVSSGVIDVGVQVSCCSTESPCVSLVNCNSASGGGTCLASGGGTAQYTCSSCTYGSDVMNGPCPRK